jgi:V8-like Glu-specific endopeptidase
MTHFLDVTPFPWTHPAARELRDYLASVYFRQPPVIQFAQDAGIPPQNLALTEPMQTVWHELITKASNQRRVRELLAAVAASDEAVAQRLQEFAAAEPVVAAPPATTGIGAWKGFDDRDALERQVFDDYTLLDIAFLQRGVDLAPAVARLLVVQPSGSFHGTAFRIGDDLLLTNHHVLFDHQAGDAPSSSVEAWFGFELDFAGRYRTHTVVNCKADTIVGDKPHDWAVVRVADPMPAGVPVIALTGAAPPRVDDRVYIIQHPQGGVKKIGMHHNIVRYADEDVVQYWTDTEAGSSGSPVFNERWELVALHHRWVEAKAAKTKEYRNQGRRITRVVEGMAAAGVR